MPWKAKRMLILWACGFGALLLAAVVLYRRDDVDSSLLAVIALLGGVAIIVNELPNDD